MTFYEAALRALEAEGKPLTVDKIVEIAVRENYLSHVGKSPEEVMQSRLLAMARRKTDRKVVATAFQTYALADWGLPEDAAALAVVPLAHPGENEPPLRPKERHPAQSSDKLRIAGRSLERPRRRREEEERHVRRRLSPLAELVSELLGGAPNGMAAAELADAVRTGGPLFEDIVPETLLAGLREENRKRQDSGRRPLFNISDDGTVRFDRAGLEKEPAVAEAAGALATLPVVEAKREERTSGMTRLLTQVVDHRRFVMRQIRRKLSELDLVGFERASLALLDAMGYREPRLVRRGKESVFLTVRRREGAVDWRTVVRLTRGVADVTRADLEQVRKEVKEQSAHLGLIMTAGESAKDTRSEAQSTAMPLVMALTGDALAERFIEKRIGATVVAVEAIDLAEDFFRRCRERAAPSAPTGGREKGRERRRPAPEAGEAPAAVETTEAAEAVASAVDPALLERRAEEARIRAEKHERIEAAEAASPSAG